MQKREERRDEGQSSRNTISEDGLSTVSALIVSVVAEKGGDGEEEDESGTAMQ